ncbi:MAG TPA: hypothetical protein VGJ06_16890 [Candidatus Acidoferrum sp.]
MPDPIVEPLILDLLQWLTTEDKTYDQVLNAWRTSCPRLPIWEDANDRGLVNSEHLNGCTFIRPSALGLALLEKSGRAQKSV